MSGQGFPDGDVAHDLRCVRCGYNLRGLDRTGQCPECGVPISVAFHPERFVEYADPAWLTAMRRAAWLCAAGIAAPCIGLIPSMIVRSLAGSAAAHVYLAFLIVALLLISAGLWCFTAGHMAELPDERPLAPRRIARLALIVSIAGQIAAWLLTHVPGRAGLAWTLFVGFSPVGVAGVVFVYFFSRRLSELGSRLRAYEFTRAARSYFRSFIAGWTVVLAGIVLMRVSGRTPPLFFVGLALAFVGAVMLLSGGVLLALLPMQFSPHRRPMDGVIHHEDD